MQKRVRGSKKRKLFCCVLVTILVFFAYGFFGSDSEPEVYENKEVVQAISEGLPLSPSYKLDNIQCFSLDCRGKHNMLANKRNKDSSATALSQEGTSILERLFADDFDSDTLSDILSKAEEKFLDAVQISGTYHRAFANLAILKYAQGKDDLALEYINQAIAIKKNIPSYYAIRALFKENNHEEYLADLKNALILDPIISQGRYFGILMSNDTRAKHHKAFPLVRSLDLEVEKKIMAKYLLWLEFAPSSLREHSQISLEMTQSFIENRYLVVKKILPKFLQEATKKCYMEYSERNLFINGDMQSPHREVMYNDRCGRFLHFALTDTVRAIVHNNVIPTYAYASLYSPGASIGPHVDRQQCEFTLSLCHLQIPANEPWAIQFGKKPLFDKDPSRGASITEKMPPRDEIVSVGLEEGDGLLLMGRHLVHLRDQTLPEGHRTHNTFLHYVASDFTGSLD